MKKTNSHMEDRQRVAPTGVMPRHKRMEEALKRSQEELRRVTDPLPLAIAYCDSNQHYRFINKAYEEWVERSRDEITGRHIRDILGEEVYGIIRGRLEAVLSGEPVTFEQAVPYREKGLRNVSVVYSPYFGARGEVEGFVAFITDITERKRAEDTLRESETRYRDLYDDAPVAYFAVGADGHIARANRRASELLGYSIDSLIGRPILDLYSDTPAGKDKAKLVVERVQRGQETLDEEMEMRRADGSPVWVSLTVRVIRDSEGQAVETRSMVLDITERKRAEEALRMAREELKSGAELQAQGADAYGLSLRELTVLNLVASGKPDKEIGITLGISARTAQKHVEKLCKKMGASTRTEASVRALREGVIR